MDLKKFLPGNNDKEAREYFWALVIEPGWVQAGIWRIEGDKAQIVFTGPSSAWELDEDLINAADTALSAAIQNFPEDLHEPSKTVFGVVSSWVTGGQIKEEHLSKIKKICSELSLKPVGFAVLSEAIAHYFKAEEGSPLNAVVLGIYKESIEVSVFKLGNLSGSTTVARSVAIVDDVVEGLSRFAGSEVLPSRFILYDGKEAELEEARQALIGVSWDETGGVNFLHTPKVEIVDIKQKVYAVSLAGASEMGDITKIVKADNGDLAGEDTNAVAQVGEDPVAEDMEGTNDSLEEYGFAVNEDVAAKAVQNEDLIKEEEYVSEEAQDYSYQDQSNVVPVHEQDLPVRSERVKTARKMSLPNFAGLLSVFSKIKIPKFLGGKTFLLGIAVFVVVLGGGFALWWFYPKATVTVYVSPQTLEERIEIVVDPQADSPDVSARVLPGDELKTEISGEKTKSTTGTKTVGDKSKGKITIYRVGTELSLAAGTVMHGPDNLRYTLDEATKVASGSAGTAGTVEASVTAEDIGAQYNLASGSTFRVGNYSTSDMEAKNGDSFSGGSSREINAVSADDQKDLLDDLTQELEEKARRGIEDELADGLLLIEESLVATPSSRIFSAKVGDEATTLKLNMSVDAVALAIDRTELENLAGEILKDKVPDGFVLRGEQITVDFEYLGQTGSLYRFESFVKANLLPSVDPEEAAKKIKGKYKSTAEEILSKEVPGFSRADIKSSPNMPGRLNTLPRVVKNIKVEVAAER
jgi:hypothetical protein